MRYLPLTALVAVVLLAACSAGRSRAWPSSPPEGIAQWQARYPKRVEEPTGASVHVLTGVRSLSDDLWQPADDSVVLGVGFTVEPPRSACGFETGFQYIQYVDQISRAAGVNLITVEQAELFFGARTTVWRGERLQPYVGGGLTMIEVTAQGSRGMSTLDDNDRSLAAYLHGGLLFRIYDRMHIGVDVRSVRGTDVLQSATLFEADGDVDYDQIALVFEWSF